jgi:methylenetetrahydrofolate dehydrogenase (NADP+)/methenyltetrahydrofolate cyclohydrolase
MSAQILDGKILAAKLKEELKSRIASLKQTSGQVPALVSIVVGDDAGSQSYALSQQRAAQSLGIDYRLLQLPQSTTQAQLLERISQLNKDNHTHGLIVNKPLPKGFDFSICADAIDKHKDIERINMCTPAAAVELLKSAGVSLAGKEAVVLGRSEIVGKPVAVMLLKEDITVTVCHSKTIDLPGHVRRADIVIAAIGKPLFVKGDWIKPGAIIIDVGINQVDGKIVGDVDFESVKSKAGFVTPVPGGVGPVTSVILMQNAFEAFKICLKS